MNPTVEEQKSQLTKWDIAQLLKSAGEAIEKIPMTVLWKIECVENDALNGLVKRCEDIKKMSEEIQRDLTEHDGMLCDVYNKHYDTIVRKHTEITKAIRSLPELPAVEVPYRFKELVEVAERFSHLDKETWDRVVELAHAMSKPAENS